MKFFESEIISLPFECPYCDKVYKNNGGLFSHFKKLHQNLIHKRIIPSGRPKKMTLREKDDIFEIFGLSEVVSTDKTLHQKWLKTCLKYVQMHEQILDIKQIEIVKKESHKLSRIYSYINNQSQLEYINKNYISAFIKVCFQQDPILKIDFNKYYQLQFKIKQYNLQQIQNYSQTNDQKCQPNNQHIQQSQIFNLYDDFVNSSQTFCQFQIFS
ncbi:hypothetical protein ABPG72_001301 [Tetrahymena utriculariae]